MEVSIQRKGKILLVLSGIAMGVLLVIPLYLLLPRFLIPKGARFDSLRDLRAALSSGSDAQSPGALKEGSVSLRALLTANDNDEIIYELRPNLNLPFQGANVRTNSFGMRQGEVSMPKPEGVFRIAFLGDSFVFGWGVEQKECFAQVLEDELNRGGGLGKKVEVLNFGVPGYSTFQEVAKFIDSGSKFQPDLVLVYFINNDFNLPFFIGDPDGGLTDSLSFVKRVWGGGSESLRKEHEKVVKLADANRALVKLGGYLKSVNTKGLIFINPSSTWDADKKKLWALRKTDQITNVDIREDLSNSIADGGYEQAALKLPRDRHPSALKHRLLGEILARKVIDAIRGPATTVSTSVTSP